MKLALKGWALVNPDTKGIYCDPETRQLAVFESIEGCKKFWKRTFSENDRVEFVEMTIIRDTIE